ncbi:thiamine pyrophosphate-dependent enzyme [Marmoricola sp. URHB0036]|uniref:thiamine pyrophosphate-dependent enzyme n=1 Tax=Marmoricola sp. URHB0036 TaxID=1298863 RepID=UPI00042A1642|nr:thiamine pyrophosphate-dependent enzyme [Marmoricola sp. URHB0036]
MTDLLERRSAVSTLLDRLPDALVVTGLGSPTYDVYAAGQRDTNFYLWGAMGGAVPLALGLALAQSDRSVLAVTGDGEQLMGIGSLASVAACAPPNLTIVVLDNGHFGETGMQASHTSLGTDLAAVARGFGIARARTVETTEQLVELTDVAAQRSGTTFACVRVGLHENARAMPPRDGVANKHSFRAALGLTTF